MGKRELDVLLCLVFLVSCDCYLSVALPYGALGWYAVCDCGFPDNTQFPFRQTGKAKMKCRMISSGLTRFAMTKQSPAKEIHFYAEFISFDTSVYTMNHSKFIALDQKEKSIRA